MTSAIEQNYERQLERAKQSGTHELSADLMRGRCRSLLQKRIQTATRRRMQEMLRPALLHEAIELSYRNDQLESLVRQMLGTIDVGLARGELSTDTLQALYDFWKEAA